MTILVNQAEGTWSIAPITPVCIGPTWSPHKDLWTPSNPVYVLPDHVGIETLGWGVLQFMMRWLQDTDEVDLDGKAAPWTPTPEQTRFILWWYAVDKNGRFMFRRGILQRLKGWGKDPLAAALAVVELVGPCRFAYWLLADGKTKSDLWEPGCTPVGRENPSAWIQVAAVTEKQTINTMALFQSMISKELIDKRRIDIGKTVIYVKGTGRRLEAITSNPGALEGNRPSFVILNETQNWLPNNEGHAMKDALEGNATKAKGGAARMLAICNAYRPGQDSVAKAWRDAWALEQGTTISTGVLLDSLEAPEAVRIIPQVVDAHTGEIIEEYDIHEEQIRAYLQAVILAVRGDATWLDVDSLVASILDTSNPASESRRKWFNQIVAAEDSWLDPAWVEASFDEEQRVRRENHFQGDPLRLGWARVEPDEPIVMFGDGSKADDATGLIGMRISDGYTFVIGVWQKHAGDTTKAWRAPRGEVNLRVEEAFDRFNIVGFLFDPSHAKEDENSTPYWNGMCDLWHQKYAERLQFWATRTGDRMHSVLWDMATPTRQSDFVQAAERTREEFRIGVIGKNDAHPVLKAHLLNAKANPENKFGTTLMKEHRESKKKIDLAVCLVGANMLRRFVMNKGLEDNKPADVWYAPVRR